MGDDEEEALDVLTDIGYKYVSAIFDAVKPIVPNSGLEAYGLAMALLFHIERVGQSYDLAGDLVDTLRKAADRLEKHRKMN